MKGTSAAPGRSVAVHGGQYGNTLLDGLRVALPDLDLVPAGGPEAAERADVLATLADDAPAIANAVTPRVGWVHVLGAGIDGFPLEAVGDRPLTCSRGASAPAIAEFVIAAMLAFEKHIPGVWIDAPPPRWNLADLGTLEGRTLGVIGLGAIGTAVSERAAAFGMEIAAIRRRSTPPPLTGVTMCPDLPALLGVSDHVVLTAPATPATRRLVDDAALAFVRPGAHFVNISRGSLVDQDALVRALDDGRLAMATLDVVDPEPLPAGHPLYSHPRVRLSPHVSWSSPRTMARTFELFAENLARYRDGRPLLGLVDKEAGY